MAAGNHPTFSLLLVTATAIGLLLAGSAEARYKGINPWCRTSDYRLLCTRMVNGAITQEQAIENAVKATFDATHASLPQIDGLAAAVANFAQTSKESVVSTCRDSYERALENLNEALSYMKQKDMHTVLDRINTAESSYYDCSAAIKEIGGNKAPLAKTNRILYRYASNSMAVATQL